MNVRSIIEFNPQSLTDTCEAMDENTSLSCGCWLLPNNKLVSLECLDALNTCGYKCFKPSDYGTLVFYKEFESKKPLPKRKYTTKDDIKVGDRLCLYSFPSLDIDGNEYGDISGGESVVLEVREDSTVVKVVHDGYIIEVDGHDFELLD